VLGKDGAGTERGRRRRGRATAVEEVIVLVVRFVCVLRSMRRAREPAARRTLELDRVGLDVAEGRRRSVRWGDGAVDEPGRRDVGGSACGSADPLTWTTTVAPLGELLLVLFPFPLGDVGLGRELDLEAGAELRRTGDGGGLDRRAFFVNRKVDAEPFGYVEAVVR
jgi:hypothetical protein